MAGPRESSLILTDVADFEDGAKTLGGESDAFGEEFREISLRGTDMVCKGCTKLS